MGFILPQFGIFAQGTHAHHFLEFDLRPHVTPTAAVASFRRLRTSEVSAGGVNLVIAFGADAWREVAPAEAPASLDRFHPSPHPTVAARPRPSTTPGSGSAAPRRTWPSTTHEPRRAPWPMRRSLSPSSRGSRTTRAGTRRASSTERRTHRSAEPRRWRSFRRVSPAKAGATLSRCDGCTTWSVSLAPGHRAGGRDRANQGRKHRARRRRQATDRTHRAGRDRGRRPRAPDLPSERPVRERRRSTVCTSWLSARTRHGTSACSRGCSGPPATAFTTA